MGNEGLYQIPPEVLYGTRMLVFLEDSPQSNRYRQVLMNEAEFKKFSASIGKITGKKGHIQTMEVALSERLYPIPDTPEIYPNKK